MLKRYTRHFCWRWSKQRVFSPPLIGAPMMIYYSSGKASARQSPAHTRKNIRSLRALFCSPLSWRHSIISVNRPLPFMALLTPGHGRRTWSEGVKERSRCIWRKERTIPWKPGMWKRILEHCWRRWRRSRNIVLVFYN